MTTFREFCIKNQAYQPVLDWLGNRTAAEFWRDCENPAWFLRVPLPDLRAERIRCGFVAADLACRKYAPAALEAVGLHEQAARLRSLPEIVDVKTAEAAEAAAVRAAAAAAAAVWVSSGAASSAAWAAAGAADAVWAADATDAAWAGWVAAWAAAPRAEMMARFREIISLDQFLKACKAAGIAYVPNNKHSLYTDAVKFVFKDCKPELLLLKKAAEDIANRADDYQRIASHRLYAIQMDMNELLCGVDRKRDGSVDPWVSMSISMRNGSEAYKLEDAYFKSLLSVVQGCEKRDALEAYLASRGYEVYNGSLRRPLGGYGCVCGDAEQPKV